MSQKRNGLPQWHGANHMHVQEPGHLHQPQTPSMQLKTHGPAQTRKMPPASPVCYPQPASKILQTKSASDQQSHVGQSLRQLVAPPVSRPQHAPKVLQTKMPASPHPINQPGRTAMAPTGYNPQPTSNVLQPKPGGARPTAARTASPSPPQALAQVIQCVRPTGAIGKVEYYRHNGNERATDGRNHWYKNHHGTWTRVPKTKVPNYNRFAPPTTGRGGERKASFKSTFGSAASYTDKRRQVQEDRIKDTREQRVTAMRFGKRTYAANMLVATTTEGLRPTNSATVYAAFFGAPVIAGGYNWCHLIGHGAGGSDDPSNILAGSTHCNSEQLQIEKIAYQYRNKGVGLSCQSERFSNSLYLARYITYRVSVNGKVVYTRRMDAFRATKPSFVEVAKVAEDLTKAITGELR